MDSDKENIFEKSEKEVDLYQELSSILNVPIWISSQKESKEDEFKLPKYSDKGSILVRVHYIDGSQKFPNRYEIEVLDYDSDSSVFWINEGVGIDYWLEDYVDFTEPGDYLIEGISGHYYKGDWGFDDDSEEWEYESIRKATPEEVKGLVD